jgi:hypothetical protein
VDDAPLTKNQEILQNNVLKIFARLTLWRLVRISTNVVRVRSMIKIASFPNSEWYMRIRKKNISSWHNREMNLKSATKLFAFP